MMQLTPEQQTRLDVLMVELATLPTVEVIIEGVRIRKLDWKTEEGRALNRTALAGGIAAEMVKSYLLALRDFDMFRTTLGQLIRQARALPFPQKSEELEEYAKHQVVADANSGVQKVVIHFYCNCVMQLHKLIRKAAKGAGYDIPEEDIAVLNAYRDLRNYFEHIESRLPGEVNAEEWVRETLTDDEWRIQVGLAVDDQGRIVIKGKTFDVTTRGLERVERVVQNAWEQLKPAALAGVREYYQTNPDDIPGPEEVRHDLLSL